MSVRIFSGTVLGIEAYRVDVEVDMSQGMPSFDLVGLPQGAVRESRIRVRSALKNSGFQHPLHSRRITVNLAPADIKKDGAGFDLPIAIGLLACFGELPSSSFFQTCLIGELALNGELRPIRGVLALVIMAKREGFQRVVVPFENRGEASIVEGIEVYALSSLGEVVDFLTAEVELLPFEAPQKEESLPTYSFDFSDVKGHEVAKRALEVAATGNHNLLMIGPPGSGKSMLAKRLPSILPPLNQEEALECTKIYSVSASQPLEKILLERPFRSPHHTISDVGLIGGGRFPKPGEVSLSHHGVLFLDELPEFRRHVLEVLRQPLEDGTVSISRSMMTLQFPSRFLLIAAMNPCPCGLGNAECYCSMQDRMRYQSKISAPLLDRIDMHIPIPSLPFSELSDKKKGESSEIIRNRVLHTREKQQKRFCRDGIHVNSEMSTQHLEEYCQLENRSLEILEKAVKRFGFSARSYHRILRVARTIADMECSERIEVPHIAEAVQYRSLDKRFLS